MKTIIKEPKSLTEVWHWKEKVYNKYLKVNKSEQFRKIKKNTATIIHKLGLKTTREITNKSI